MRKTLFLMITLAAALMFASQAYPQQQRPLLGGYKEIAKTDTAVKKAAIFGVAAEAKRSEKEIDFISVIKAERQIVGGTNYRMCLKVSDEGAEGQDAAEVFVKAIVNVDLKGVYKLLSWEASDCGEEDEAPAAGAVPEPKFVPIATTNPETVLAADFAKSNAGRTGSFKLHWLVKNSSVQRFGVTNRNFQLCMTGTENGKQSSARAVVSMDKDSKTKVISWTDMKC